MDATICSCSPYPIKYSPDRYATLDDIGRDAEWWVEHLGEDLANVLCLSQLWSWLYESAWPARTHLGVKVDTENLLRSHGNEEAIRRLLKSVIRKTVGIDPATDGNPATLRDIAERYGIAGDERRFKNFRETIGRLRREGLQGWEAIENPGPRCEKFRYKPSTIVEAIATYGGNRDRPIRVANV